MMRTVTLLSLLLAAGAPRAQAPRPGAAAPLAVSDALGVLGFTDRNQLDLSPDGALVAFALQDPRRLRGGGHHFDDASVPGGHRGTDVYVADTRTGAHRRLTGGTGSSWAPVWSPDGRFLAFYSDRDGVARLWLWDRERDQLRRLGDGVVRSFFGFEQVRWSPDGRRVLVKLLPEGMTVADAARLLPDESASAEARRTGQTSGVSARAIAFSPAPPDTAAYAATARPAAPVSVDGVRSFLNVELADLALVDVPSGRTRRIARRVRAMGYRFSPNGAQVAFSTRQPDGGRGVVVYNRYDLWVADTAGGAPPRLLAPATIQSYGLGFSWSPDGARIAWVSDGAVYVGDAAGGATKPQRIAREGTSFAQENRPPLWLDDTTLVVAVRDTLWRLSAATGAVAPAAVPRDRRQLAELLAPAHAERVEGPDVTVVVRDPRTKRAGFQRLDLRTGQAEALFEDDIAIGATDLPYHVDLSRDGRTVAFVAENGSRPPEVWVADAGLARRRRLTSLHAAVAGRTLGASRLVEWTDARGRSLQGALLLPAGYEPGRRYPLVVKLYGGSLLSGRVNRFGLESHAVDNLQLLATRGYAVLLPDVPLRVGTPMADVAAAVLPGVDAVVAMGVADSGRVGVMGHSYGGYSALAVAVQSPRVKAVVVSGGFGNLLGQYALLRDDGSTVSTGWAETGQGRMGAHPWAERQRYIDNSPFYFLDRVTAPVLLLHGAADAVVRPEHAEETFVALRRLGKPVTLVRYDGEEHHPGTWRPENAADYWERIFGWFERHLGEK